MKFFTFKNLKYFFEDIRNYLILIQTIKKHRNTADWQRFNLRTDWVNRIYTVFNPRPEDKGDDANVIKIKLGERMIPCHKYIDSIGLSEIVGVSGEQIPDSESYLVVYYPLFRYITVWRMIRNIILVSVIFYFRESLYEYTVNLYTFFKTLINF